MFYLEREILSVSHDFTLLPAVFKVVMVTLLPWLLRYHGQRRRRCSGVISQSIFWIISFCHVVTLPVISATCNISLFGLRWNQEGHLPFYLFVSRKFALIHSVYKSSLYGVTQIPRFVTAAPARCLCNCQTVLLPPCFSSFPNMGKVQQSLSFSWRLKTSVTGSSWKWRVESLSFRQSLGSI